MPHYAKSSTSVITLPSDIDEVARLVIRGDYGNGQERVSRLTAAGYDASAVQKRVNQILIGK